LSPQDVGSALALTNPVIPSGTIRVGGHTYDVDINMSPETVSEFNQLPVKVTNGTPVLLGQIAPVSDTHQPQVNAVQINGRPATYLLVIKQAAASTITVVDEVKSRLPGILAVAPKGLKVALTFDQSVFVRAALWDVLQEAETAALLVAIMVLVFVGSARSMLIVITSIPLAILTSIIALNLFGQTINTMTLAGLALAVGTNSALYPGMYGTMSLTVKVPTSAPLVPDDELIFRDGKVFVPLVRNSVVHLAPVTLGFDNGYSVEATSGVSMDDLIALNLGQSATEGEKVHPVQTKTN
jgi:hypothetical protein